ncbi:MAG: DUF4399 domain-containing protein [Burkholderiaceae bacterium]|nr:DUF4399 domain-containing protein [Burkholderiaceae bacterium]
MPKPTGPSLSTGIAVLLLAFTAGAEPLPRDPLERRCWVAQTQQRTGADLREPVRVRISNLRNGYQLRAPFWVEFGIRGMGVIPAGTKHDKAGHHHLLIDTPLPKDPREQIPFSSTHKHFGKGQTGTELDLPPGEHTLRLLFADHEHRPYFVFSPEITVRVLGRRDATTPTVDAKDFEASCALWYQDHLSTPPGKARQVYVKNLRDEEPVASPFVLSLGVIGFGVAPAGQSIAETGHFELIVSGRGGAPSQRVLLADGRTEAMLDLPRGDYEIELRLLDGSGAVLLKAPPLKVPVVRQER